MSSWDKKLNGELNNERRFASHPNSTNAFVSGCSTYFANLYVIIKFVDNSYLGIIKTESLLLILISLTDCFFEPK